MSLVLQKSPRRLLPTAALLLCACGDAPPSGTHAEPAESGIFAAASASGRLPEAPLLVLGASEDAPLDDVDGVVLRESRLAIANGNEILFFGMDGEPAGRKGGEGVGPGEYRSLHGLLAFGDSLLAWDIGLSRLSVRDAEGDFGRSIQIAPVPPPPGSGPAPLFMSVIGRFGNGVLFERRSLALPEEGIHPPHESRWDRHYDIYDLRSGDLVWSTSRAGEEMWGAALATGMTGGMPVVFGRTAVAAAAHGRTYVGVTESAELTAWNDAGDSTRVEIPALGTPRDVEDGWSALVRDSVEADAARLSGSPFLESLAEFRRVLLAGLPERETLPLFADLAGGSDGTLWIQEYPAPLEPHVTWVGLDERMAVTRRLQVPRAAKVLQFGDDRLVLLRRDAFDREVVEVYAYRGG